jgi:hypothetical protein
VYQQGVLGGVLGCVGHHAEDRLRPAQKQAPKYHLTGTHHHQGPVGELEVRGLEAEVIGCYGHSAAVFVDHPVRHPVRMPVPPDRNRSEPVRTDRTSQNRSALFGYFALAQMHVDLAFDALQRVVDRLGVAAQDLGDFDVAASVDIHPEHLHLEVG